MVAKTGSGTTATTSTNGGGNPLSAQRKTLKKTPLQTTIQPTPAFFVHHLMRKLTQALEDIETNNEELAAYEQSAAALTSEQKALEKEKADLERRVALLKQDLAAMRQCIASLSQSDTSRWQEILGVLQRTGDNRHNNSRGFPNRTHEAGLSSISARRLLQRQNNPYLKNPYQFENRIKYSEKTINPEHLRKQKEVLSGFYMHSLKRELAGAKDILETQTEEIQSYRDNEAELEEGNEKLRIEIRSIRAAVNHYERSQSLLFYSLRTFLNAAPVNSVQLQTRAVAAPIQPLASGVAGHPERD